MKKLKNFLRIFATLRDHYKEKRKTPELPDSYKIRYIEEKEFTTKRKEKINDRTTE